MKPINLTHSHFLIHLRLSDCRIDTQPTLALPNLRHLDLSGNGLARIDIQHFHSLKNLRVLVLSGNPLSAITNTVPSEPGTMVLQTIDLSGTSLDVYNGSALAGCPKLKTLNISRSIKLTMKASSPRTVGNLRRERFSVEGLSFRSVENSSLSEGGVC